MGRLLGLILPLSLLALVSCAPHERRKVDKDAKMLSMLGLIPLDWRIFDVDMTDILGLANRFTVDPCDQAAETWSEECLDELLHQVTFTRESRTGDVDPTTVAQKKVYFIIHGFQDSSDSNWVLDMKAALLQNEDCVVMTIDWSPIAGNINYLAVVNKLPRLGKALATEVERMVGNSLLPGYDRITCIGHSLGAHTCGFTAKNSPRRFARISGLDPAAPGFSWVGPELRLDRTDADFVDVIHTTIKSLGISKPVGHIDFYPNYGEWQPGCGTYVNIGCRHSRAYEYYIQSITNDCFATYHSCYFLDSWYLIKMCPSSWWNTRHSMMGFHADEYEAEGSYYVETESGEPYCVN